MKNVSLALVFLGSISYGMPAPLMKLANVPGGQTGGVIFFVFVLSSLVLNVLSFIRKNNQDKLGGKALLKIMFSGIPLALTTSFYFASLKYIPVSVAVVMLMQSVWISQLIDYVVFRKVISLRNVISIMLILTGTVLATKVTGNLQEVSLTGLILAFLGAVSYAATIQITGRIRTDISPLQKATILSSGACVISVILWYHSVRADYLIHQIYWGGLISIFAIIIPAVTFSAGMPKISPGLGAIITSLELPCAILFAWLLLGEAIDTSGFIGVTLILIAVVCGALPDKKIA